MYADNCQNGNQDGNHFKRALQLLQLFFIEGDFEDSLHHIGCYDVFGVDALDHGEDDLDDYEHEEDEDRHPNAHLALRVHRHRFTQFA